MKIPNEKSYEKKRGNEKFTQVGCQKNRMTM